MHYGKPTKWVWKNVKHDGIGRSAVRGKGEMKAVALSVLWSLQKVPAKVCGFFEGPKLAYIFQ
jgi:hypothetical protein